MEPQKLKLLMSVFSAAEIVANEAFSDGNTDKDEVKVYEVHIKKLLDSIKEYNSYIDKKYPNSAKP